MVGIVGTDVAMFVMCVVDVRDARCHYCAVPVAGKGFMAKPITTTPPVTGEAAKKILYEIKYGTPNTPERLAFLRESDAVYAKIQAQLNRAPRR